MRRERHPRGRAHPSRILLGLCLGLVVTAAGCGGSSPTVAPTAEPGTPRPPAPTAAPRTPTAEPGTPRPPAPTAAPRTPSPGAERPDLAAVAAGVEEVASGFEQPLWVSTDGIGDGRLYVAEQAGRIRVLEIDGSIATQPFLDITDRVGSGGERGLLGFAFPPGYGVSEPVVYVHYTDRAGDTTLSAFGPDPRDNTRLDPASERVLLTVPQPYANHNGGWVGFDADGMLLLALGDGGAGGDPENRASDTGQLLGKILRIDVTGAADGEPYAIPADNPFADGSAGRPEILHFGLRNPFRASIDTATGDLWIGDVGQNAWEEIDVAPAGARGLDFGWRRWEGRHCYDPSPAADCSEAGVTMPVAEYPHGAGCSVIGGVVYRGAAIPALRGAYLFSDYCSGTVWAIDAGLDAEQAPLTILETGRQISAIGTDAAGEVLLTDLGGTILRLVPAG